MSKKNEWWIKAPPKFKYKVAKSRMEKDGKGWKVRPKTEEEIDSDHIVSETIKRKRETALWAKYLDGKTFDNSISQKDYVKKVKSDPSVIVYTDEDEEYSDGYLTSDELNYDIHSKSGGRRSE